MVRAHTPLEPKLKYLLCQVTTMNTSSTLSPIPDLSSSHHPIYVNYSGEFHRFSLIVVAAGKTGPHPPRISCQVILVTEVHFTVTATMSFVSVSVSSVIEQ